MQSRVSPTIIHLWRPTAISTPPATLRFFSIFEAAHFGAQHNLFFFLPKPQQVLLFPKPNQTVTVSQRKPRLERLCGSKASRFGHRFQWAWQKRGYLSGQDEIVLLIDYTTLTTPPSHGKHNPHDNSWYWMIQISAAWHQWSCILVYIVTTKCALALGAMVHSLFPNPFFWTLASVTPIFGLSLDFELSYTSKKFSWLHLAGYVDEIYPWTEI